eukprot:6200535-Pleurochrysis_carterae.AAC.2
MLSSDADVKRSLPAWRAFTVVTGPLAHTPPAPSSSSIFSLPPPSPVLITCVALCEVFLPFRTFGLFLLGARPILPKGLALTNSFSCHAKDTHLSLTLRVLSSHATIDV